MSKLTIEDLYDLVENEGLDYAIQHNSSVEDIEDPEMAKLWGDAKTALDAIQAKLDAFAEARDEQEDDDDVFDEDFDDEDDE